MRMRFGYVARTEESCWSSAECKTAILHAATKVEVHNQKMLLRPVLIEWWEGCGIMNKRLTFVVNPESEFDIPSIPSFLPGDTPFSIGAETEVGAIKIHVFTLATLMQIDQHDRSQF